MARTYTVQGHIKRRDGKQEAFWTRTGLTKSAAAKLAKEQRVESGGVAKIVPEEGPAYGHATRKKSPAQLDREITEALSRAPGGGGLTSLDAVQAAAKHARDSGARRGRAHATVKADLDQLDNQIAPTLGKTPAQIVRAINTIVRAADGRNVYLVRERMGSPSVRRVVGARAMPGTKGRGIDVRLLDSGTWIGVLAEMGDKIDVR